MRRYPWLRPHFKQLIRSYQKDSEHYALLMQAIPGMGDEILIYEITRFLMCHYSIDYKSCGECRSCQLMQLGMHPDFYLLAPKKGQNTLGIDLIREVSERLYKCTQISSEKVVWLTNAALLTEEAENSLLKILEEPPNRTWFFLSCHEFGCVRATLRSRCRLYHLTIPQESKALSWIEHKVTSQSKETIITALRLCGGAPLTALVLLNTTLCLRRKHLCISLKLAIENGDWLSLLTALNHDQVTDSLYWVISLFLDALKIKYGITLIINIDNQVLVNTIADHATSETLQVILQDLCICREHLLCKTGTNINRELILTNQLMSIEHYLKSQVNIP